MKDVKIDPEFRALVFPLAEAEAAMLEESLLAEGCRDALVVWRGLLLDGHHRLEVCQRHGIEFETKEVDLADRTAAKVWVIRNQFARRNLTPFQRAEIALRLEPLITEQAKRRMLAGNPVLISEQGRTLEKVAEQSGLGKDTIWKVKKIQENVPGEIQDELRQGEKSINAVFSEMQKDIKFKEIEAKRQKMAKEAEAIKPDDRWFVEVGDVEKYQTDKRFDFIITDPPYPKEYLPLYEILARRADEWLKPDGLLIVMCGQSYLDKIIGMISKYMNYYWIACYLTPGQPTPLKARQVNTSWKPVLIYAKNDYKGKIFGDVFKSDKPEKDFDEWEQSISGMASLIKQICLPGQIIFDPFLGAGTTGMAALQHGCLFHGIDIDENKVMISRGRLSNQVAYGNEIEEEDNGRAKAEADRRV